MPWCPKCKTEFEKGVKVCSACNVELVAGSSFVLLTTFDQREGEIIEQLLKSHGINVLKKFKEAGGYLDIYMGGSIFGVDLYVPAKQLETAQEIISASPIEEDTD